MEKKNEKNDIKGKKENNGSRDIKDQDRIEEIKGLGDDELRNCGDRDLWSDSAKDEEKSVQFYYSQSWDSTGKSTGMAGVSYNSDLIEDLRRRESENRRRSSVSDSSCKGCIAF